jgi:hypothetical protein
MTLCLRLSSVAFFIVAAPCKRLAHDSIALNVLAERQI